MNYRSADSLCVASARRSSGRLQHWCLFSAEKAAAEIHLTNSWRRVCYPVRAVRTMEHREFPAKLWLLSSGSEQLDQLLSCYFTQSGPTRQFLLIYNQSRVSLPTSLLCSSWDVFMQKVWLQAVCQADDDSLKPTDAGTIVCFLPTAASLKLGFGPDPDVMYKLFLCFRGNCLQLELQSIFLRFYRHKKKKTITSYLLSECMFYFPAWKKTQLCFLSQPALCLHFSLRGSWVFTTQRQRKGPNGNIFDIWVF